MSVASYTDREGFTFRVFSTLYMDWGLEITDPDGNTLFINPHALSSESYGNKPNPDKDFVDWDEAYDALLEGDEDAFVAWDENDWRSALQHESDELIEAYTVSCKSCEKVINYDTAKTDKNIDFFCEGCFLH